MNGEYHRKLSSPREAVRAVKSGEKVVLANLCAEPHALPGELMSRAEELRGVRLFHLRPFGQFIDSYLKPEMEEHVRCATAFAGGVPQMVRLIRDGRADFYPIPLSMIPWLFKTGAFRPDVFMTTVSPVDSQGYCSLGVSVDYARAALEMARTVIAEVNDNIPRTYGDSLVHISEIDQLVESSESIYEMPRTEVTSLERRLAENVASLVEDGATIQIGYGAVSESITPFLSEKRELGMHTEMFPESAMTLVEQGALTCERKSIDKGKIVCAFAAGTRRLYDWLNENSRVVMRTLDYTNDSRVIAMSHKMTAINTALQVDLYGNTYSDMLGFDEYSGAGGQPDFVLGATLSHGGKSIIVLPSTASEGGTSRIVASPNLGGNAKTPSIPTVARFHADYVVTEFGIASLRDKTTRERARALIEIAHPKFKQALQGDAGRIGLMT